MNYQEFIKSKVICDIPTGIKDISAIKINPMLFDFQRDVVRWALHRGRACIWADCGLGKTPMQPRVNIVLKGKNMKIRVKKLHTAAVMPKIDEVFHAKNLATAALRLWFRLKGVQG